MSGAGARSRVTLPARAQSRHLIRSIPNLPSLPLRFALQTQDAELKSEALEVLAENRAASLREQMALAFGQDFRLPGDYLETPNCKQRRPGSRWGEIVTKIKHN